MTITFEEIRNSERYGDCNEVNYDLIFEDIQKGILKKYKRKSPEKFSKCVCSHSFMVCLNQTIKERGKENVNGLIVNANKKVFAKKLNQ